MIIEAKLLFDSARTELGLGVRSIASAQRNLVFRSELYSVDVVMYPDGDDFGVIHGQVVHEPSGSPISDGLIRIDDGECVETDDFGQFAIPTATFA